MIKINEKDIILTKQEYNNSKYLDKAFDINKNEKNNRYLFVVNFTNKLRYNIKLLKRLKHKIEKKNLNGVEYNNYNLIGLINNSNEQIDNCLKAIFIKNKDEKYEFIYDTICDELDEKWNEEKPCDFKCDICIYQRETNKIPRKNGCCYSFWYSRNLLKIEGIHQCDYFDKEKHCTNKNISCKLFACAYLKRKKKFYINEKDVIIIQLFFNKYQKYVIKHNFFVSREQLIEKLKKEEKRIKPVLLYYANRDFMIYKTTPKEKRDIAKEYDIIYKKTRWS